MLITLLAGKCERTVKNSFFLKEKRILNDKKDGREENWQNTK